MKTDIMRKIEVLAVAILLVVADQVTKSAVISGLKVSGRQTVTIIPGLLELNYLENPAAAFGLFGDVIWLVVALTLVVAGGIVAGLFLYRHHGLFSYLASTLLLAGGIGNLVDRIIRGYVVDFIHVMFFGYIFNVADCCVTVGALCLVVHCLWATYKEKKTGTGPELSEKPEDLRS